MSKIYQKAKNFRLLSGVPFTVANVYTPYRSGGLEIAGKFVGKSFYLFPKENGEGEEFREKIWDKEAREFRFVKYEGKLDREFFATYKKVFDVEVILGSPVTLPVWDSVSRTEVNTVVPAGETVSFSGIASSKIKSMIEDLDLDEDVILVKGKDKAGNEAQVKPFDWEDETKNFLIGQVVEMKVKGTGMDTKYKFKQGKNQSATDGNTGGISILDVPF